MYLTAIKIPSGSPKNPFEDFSLSGEGSQPGVCYTCVSSFSVKLFRSLSYFVIYNPIFCKLLGKKNGAVLSMIWRYGHNEGKAEAGAPVEQSLRNQRQKQNIP